MGHSTSSAHVHLLEIPQNGSGSCTFVDGFAALMSTLNECWKVICCVRSPRVNCRISDEVSSFENPGIVRVQPTAMNTTVSDSVSNRNSIPLCEVRVENPSTIGSGLPNKPLRADARRLARNRIKMGLRSTSHGSDYDHVYADVVVNNNPMPPEENVADPIPKRSRPAYQCHRRYNSIAPVTKNRRSGIPYGFSKTPEWMRKSSDQYVSSSATDRKGGDVTSSEEEGSTTLVG
ncbi:hypothetical protein J6590_035020 [Homalodisca vitripennis]|nr:hypothetical protein J6590_035020 [Homalodisca vitripennis]